MSRIESLQLFNVTDVNAPLAPIDSADLMRDAIGLAYDYDARQVLYSDIQKGSINAVSFDGTDHRVLIPNVGSVEGLVYDQHNGVLYWTSNADNSVSKALIRGSHPPYQIEKVVQLQWNDKPRGIDIDTCDGVIYFTNWNTHAPSVQRVWSSGYGLESVVTTEIRMPNAIAVDSGDRKLFWGDARLDKIERVDLDTLERTVLARASPQHPFDIAVFGQFLFYTDWVLHSVVRVNKYTGEDVSWLRKNIPRPMSLVAVGKPVADCPSWSDPCVTLNGGCDDLCSMDDSGAAVCSCYANRHPLNPSNSRCSDDFMQCENREDFPCAAGLGDTGDPICIPYNLTCDGVQHCLDGSDEESKYCAVRRCKSGFFHCSNNRCVLPEAKCDGKNDCGDFSDESVCGDCPKERFRCHNGPCIKSDLVCDGRPDCKDASDEIGCPDVNCTTAAHVSGKVDRSKLYQVSISFS